MTSGPQARHSDGEDQGREGTFPFRGEMALKGASAAVAVRATMEAPGLAAGCYARHVGVHGVALSCNVRRHVVHI